MSVFLPIIEGLNTANVEYVVVGGMATIFHGYARVTTDIDLVLRLEQRNVERAIEVISGLGYIPRLPGAATQFADAKIRESWIRDTGLMVFSFFNQKRPTVGIDLFLQPPMEPEHLFSRSEWKPLGRVRVRVCHLDDLLIMKQNAGRAIDLEDIRRLKEIRDARQKP